MAGLSVSIRGHDWLAPREHPKQTSRGHQDDGPQHQTNESEGSRAAEQSKEHDESAGRGPAGKQNRTQDIVSEADGKDADQDQNDSAPAVETKTK